MIAASHTGQQFKCKEEVFGNSAFYAVCGSACAGWLASATTALVVVVHLTLVAVSCCVVGKNDIGAWFTGKRARRLSNLGMNNSASASSLVLPPQGVHGIAVADFPSGNELDAVNGAASDDLAIQITRKMVVDSLKVSCCSSCKALPQKRLELAHNLP